MKREFYSDSIIRFLSNSKSEILGEIVSGCEFDINNAQKLAWEEEVEILQDVLKNYSGTIYFEYSIPRIGKRVDVILLIGGVIFVLEFKVGEIEFSSFAKDQVWDYALDLKNFHSSSYEYFIAPILIATNANVLYSEVSTSYRNDKIFNPILSSSILLKDIIENILLITNDRPIDRVIWDAGRYCPTPTIVEAAMALYNGHGVENISRSDASAINLRDTSNEISDIIQFSKEKSIKSICFVTGVPGAGKTLVGLNIATKHIDKNSDLYSVFLSGNGPLVAVLREALARDRVKVEKEKGKRIRKGEVLSEVKLFIQNVHHFRDECLIDELRPPIEHVALFDEAQRAWDADQTSKFMKRKKKRSNFTMSEPEFLISCLDRHKDWASIVCLVGGGQEINQGESGISEWIESILRSFPHWSIFISPHLSDSEYSAKNVLPKLKQLSNVIYKEELHLAVSMRSFRAENVSNFVKSLLDINIVEAKNNLSIMEDKYPIVLSRSLLDAKLWLKEHARGTERYGIVVSSQAQRLKPHAIDVKTPIDPLHWFLDDKSDVRSSFYLEDVATEFHIQGLELDWACVTWDADFRFNENGWSHFSFCGSRWNQIRKPERKKYQINAYRVLLTRARQGMVIVVPEGGANDPTRSSIYYDSTFEYLKEIGLKII